MRDRSVEGRDQKRFRPGKLLLRIVQLVVLAFLGWLWLVWPPPIWYRWAWPRETAFMAMRRHETAADRAPPLRLYQPIPIEQIPPTMRSAVLVAEDHRFYEHAGIDYVEFRHALGYRPDSFSWGDSRNRRDLFRALAGAWDRRNRLRGASTITQQLAKNLYLSSSRSPLRKLKEAITAWRLEYWLGKERILELYLNVVELGPEVWGVEAASRKYFGHAAPRLSLEESAALAATLPFPLASNPGFHPGRMRWRQSMIIRRLHGEDVVIPPVPDLPPLPDTLLLDTLRIPVDTTTDTLKRKRDSLP